MKHADEIKSKLDIVDIISEYLNLKAAGSNFKALCPFHNEKTPSFMISPDKQIWRCFGCGKGGDLISFVMDIEGLDFVETLKLLAPRAGVVLDNKDFSGDSKKNKLLEIMELSVKYYHFLLKSEKGDPDKIKGIKKYLADRGLGEDALDRWRIGYSLDSSDDLIKFLKSKGFNDSDILLSGMSFKSKNGQYFNRFRDRIMFPINDLSGRAVAFTARVNPQSKEESLGKYINSPQTEIYDKSRILFGLDKAKMAIREKDEIILVEGQMDAISAQEAGFLNLTAVSGTSLTILQLNLIKRYTKNIVLAFDQDSAGKTATDRGVSEALKMGLNLRIAIMESGKDPDDIIRENPENFRKAIEEAKNIMDYYLLKEFEGIDISDIRQKNKAINNILIIISKLYNKVEQDYWIKELSQNVKVEEVFLREELQKVFKSSPREKDEKKDAYFSKIIQSSWEDKLMENLLSLVLKYNDYCEYVFNNLESKYILGSYKEFYNFFLIYYNRNKKIDYRGLETYLLDEKQGSLADSLKRVALVSDFFFSEEDFSLEKIKEELSKNILEIKRNYFKEIINKKKDELILAEKNSDNSRLSEIMEDLKKFNDELKKLM